MPEMSDTASLLAIEIETLWVADAAGRLLHTREADPSPAPDFVVAHTESERVLTFSSRVQQPLARELEALAASTDDSPTTRDSGLALLEAHLGPVTTAQILGYLIDANASFPHEFQHRDSLPPLPNRLRLRPARTGPMTNGSPSSPVTSAPGPPPSSKAPPPPSATPPGSARAASKLVSSPHQRSVDVDSPPPSQQRGLRSSLPVVATSSIQRPSKTPRRSVLPPASDYAKSAACGSTSVPPYRMPAMTDTLTAAEFEARVRAMQSDDELRKIQRYFKTGAGDYGEGDVFIGVRMGSIFALAKEFLAMELAEIETLLESEVHELRVGAVSIMAKRAAHKKTTEDRRKELFDLYLRRHDRINNWDLVDLGAWNVVGRYLADEPRDVLLKTRAVSQPAWERRTVPLPACTSSARVTSTTPSASANYCSPSRKRSSRSRSAGLCAKQGSATRPGSPRCSTPTPPQCRA